MSKVTIVEFYADWCGACQAQNPILEELERELGHKTDIIKIGLTDNQELIQRIRNKCNTHIIYNKK